jgi:drug/metabolite transporter (DMT)-like permease
MSRNWKSSSTLAITALVGVTAVWGATFLVVQKAISRMPVMDFLALRFTIAALMMIALRPKCVRGITRNELRHGIILGLVLGSGYILQTYGLLSASAAVSGFITGMFVVLTPVMAWVILRNQIGSSSGCHRSGFAQPAWLVCWHRRAAYLRLRYLFCHPYCWPGRLVVTT